MRHALPTAMFRSVLPATVAGDCQRLTSLVAERWRAAGRAAVGTWLAVATIACAPTPGSIGVPAAPVALDGEAAIGMHLGKRAEGRRGLVAAGHPAAAEAGREMLRKGGNAVDAAVATAFALGVVEPMMSGLGGSGGMVVWDAQAGRADFLEFYATAGARVDTTLHLATEPLGARAVAVPGEVAGLLAAHERWGRLTRQEVMAPAIRLAEEGFPVHAMLARVVQSDSAKLAASAARDLFLPGGRPLPPGAHLRQPELAATLRRIAAEGRDGFYRGPVAAAIVRALEGSGNPITLDDLAGYEPRWRRPICGTYLGRTVLTASPPLSGAQVVASLNLLELQDWSTLGLPHRDVRAFDALTTSLRAARADRDAYSGDPASAWIPAAALASERWAARRLADATARPERQAPGDPRGVITQPEGRCAQLDPWRDAPPPPSLPAREAPDDDGDDMREGGETTHLSVVDAEGNAVALTITQGLYFGSGVWVAGTFLNSAMANFRAPDAPSNAIGPGRIPATTTAPTIVLDADGRTEVVIGSPASGRIPPAIAQTLLYTLQFGLDPYTAVSLPRIYPWTSSRRVQLEQGFAGEVLGGARTLGWELQQHPPTDFFFGGVTVLVRRDGRWIGAADPRRSGEVRSADR